MPRPIVIADEFTALGFRLAGALTFAPQEHEMPQLFADICSDSELVLMTAEKAACLPPAQLSKALLAERPLLMIIPSARDTKDVDDLARELRRALGVDQ